MREPATRVFRAIGTGVRQPFHEAISDRMLIYPIDYTMLTPDQFGAVAAGAEVVGDTYAYVVSYGTLEAGWAGTYDHRLVGLNDYRTYRPRGAVVLEHLLYSPSGSWGVITSDGGEAVVGGPWAFIDRVRSNLPESEELMATAFVRDQKAVGHGGGNIEWLRPLLRHLYGDAKAEHYWTVEAHGRSSG